MFECAGLYRYGVRPRSQNEIYLDGRFTNSLGLVLELVTLPLRKGVGLVVVGIVGSLIGTSMCLMILRVKISHGRNYLTNSNDSTHTLHFRPQISVRLDLNTLRSLDTVKDTSSITEMDTEEGKVNKHGVVL